jgi:predicted amidophosphoribosyltransferase
MEKCIKCNKISYSLANGLCKRCSKESNMTINKCFRCEKITAYSIDGMCIECSQMSMSLETIIKKLEIKDPKKLSDILKVKESLIINLAEGLKIKGFRKYKCHKCGKNIEKIGLCDNCSELYNTLKNMDHVKKLRKISEKGEGAIHVKTK